MARHPGCRGLLALPIPGIDELRALVEIVRLAGALPDRGRPRASGQYDLVIVDTAPIGHTLRLLAAPETVGVVAAVLDDLQQHHRLIRQQLARVRRPEAADRLIDLLAKQAQETGALLRDSERATFHWVMLPEDLSLAESETALRRLSDARIPVAEVIVNHAIELLSPAHGTRAGVVYDTIVIDTAPTGHALRLLEMPDAAREWVLVLLRGWTSFTCDCPRCFVPQTASCRRLWDRRSAADGGHSSRGCDGEQKKIVEESGPYPPYNEKIQCRCRQTCECRGASCAPASPGAANAIRLARVFADYRAPAGRPDTLEPRS